MNRWSKCQGRLGFVAAPEMVIALTLLTLLLVVIVPIFRYSTRLWPYLSYEAHSGGGFRNVAAQSFSFNSVAGNSAVVWFVLPQSGTATAVTSPALSVTPAEAFQATLGRERTPVTGSQPASGMVSPPTMLSNIAVLRPTSEQDQAQVSLPTMTGESVTVTMLPFPATQSVLTQEVATATAIVGSDTSDTTPYTGQGAVRSGSLLDRMTRNKPGVWGNRLFYVGLGVVYVVLLALFLRVMLRLGRQVD